MKKFAMLLVLLSACASAIPPKATTDNSDIEAVLRSTYDVIQWKVLTIFWQQEDDAHPIPAMYL